MTKRQVELFNIDCRVQRTVPLGCSRPHGMTLFEIIPRATKMGFCDKEGAASLDSARNGGVSHDKGWTGCRGVLEDDVMPSLCSRIGKVNL